MQGIEVIKAEEINEALKQHYRQYLVGKLTSEQNIENIEDKNVEVGLSYYKEFSSDMPHIHSKVTEYQFVIEGETHIWNVISEEVIELKKGDFYCVKPNTPYAQKSKGNTKIIFFKYPGENDKKIIEVNGLVSKWLVEKI